MEALREEFKDSKQQTFTLDDILEIIDRVEEEEKERLKDTLPFGKYKGKKLDAIAVFDVEYLQWATEQPFYKKFPDIHDKVATLIKANKKKVKKKT